MEIKTKAGWLKSSHFEEGNNEPWSEEEKAILEEMYKGTTTTFNEDELEVFRKHSYWRGFRVGVAVTLLLIGIGELILYYLVN